MFHGGAIGELELRRDGTSAGRRLRGTFPYNKLAVLSDGGRNGGRPKKERIAPRAFSYRIERDDEDIHLLVGHSYDRPLASRASDTLTLRDSAEAVTFDAKIGADLLDAPYVRDGFAALSAGLMAGVSPGFRLPPPRTVPDAEMVEDEDPAEGTAIIRTVLAALLYEFSLVTVPAYREATAEARAWSPSARGPAHPLKRWRL